MKNCISSFHFTSLILSFQVWSDISSKGADLRTIFPIIKQRTEAAGFNITGFLHQ